MKYLLLLLSILVPTTTHAAVLFSEVAWMGTDADANNEWIELYNFSNTPTDVTGWIVTMNDAAFITLSGTISPHGVVVLERTDDNTLPGTAFQIYTGILSNEKDTKLTLKDGSGAVVDEIVGGMKWINIGGSNVKPKMTPQRTRTGSWVTGVPTPGAENVQENTVVPEGPDDAESDNGGTDTTTQTTSVSKKSGGGGGSAKTVTVKDESAPGVLSLSLTTPTVVYVNQPMTFEVMPSGLGPTMLASLVHTWNFGDTYTAVGKKVTHTFTHPGEYVVVVESKFGKHTDMVRQTITIIPNSLVIEKTETGDVVIKNTSKYEVDLGGYEIKGTEKFIFPKYTFVKAGGALTIPKERFGGGVVILRDVKKVIAARTEQEVPLGTSQQIPLLASVVAPRVQPMVEKKVDKIPAEVAVAASSQTNTQVVQIGAAVQSEESQGMFKRLWSRISGIFGD